MKKTTFTQALLAKKSEEQLLEIVKLDFGYSLGIEKKSASQLIELILELQQAIKEKEDSKFDFLDHLKDHLPMTEKMITDAFYTSSPAFRQNYLKDADLTEERKKDIFHEVRDIVISNNFKVSRPGANKSTETEREVRPTPIKEEAPAPAPIQTEEAPVEIPKVEEKETAQDSFDPMTLKKKGDKANYIIDILIAAGGDILKDIKTKMVMEKYVEIFNEDISDGYAYDKIYARKKEIKETAQNES